MSESASPNGAPTKGGRKTKPSTQASVPRAKTARAASPGTQINPLHLAAIDRRAMIETAAFYRAERRRFQTGHELEDWLSAEAEIEALLRARLESAGRDSGSA